ncbi:MAG: tetratricopeptide repeat protein, partial [Planctomycetes bacterium]|nr:tetratricopeptide repeat protein [Planctomycetota bacterium]
PALEALISIISRDKTYRNGEPKSLVLSIFDVVGRRSELSDAYRKQLSSILY